MSTYGPEFDEILDDSSTNYYTVEWSVRQEQDKVLVVWESNTVIHPEKETQWKHETKSEIGSSVNIFFKSKLRSWWIKKSLNA